MGERRHDLIATLINQPVSSLEELALNGVLPSNTEIKDLDYYLNIEKVQTNPMFITNGAFDKDKFKAFHTSALRVFEEYSNGDYIKKALDAIESSPRDWTKLDAQRYDTDAVVKIQNVPNKMTMGMSTDPVARFSDAEMAQANFMRDENGNVLDWTPNERGGLWQGIFRKPAALAVYEEDGTHEENGVVVNHKKGELQRDKKGNPFYQELGSKSAEGRQLLRYTDTFTVEGQWLNDYDFFDSDGLKKSAAGVVAKTAFSIVPYFIPYVGPALKYVMAAKELATAMPPFLKALNNIFESESGDDSFDKKMNEFSNRMQTFKMGTSEAGQNFWSFEGLMNQVASSAGQLYQQRAVGNLAKILPKDIAAPTGRALSTAYMALTSSQYSYDEFKKAGATDQIASVGALASFAAMYGLMSMGYFKQWTTKGTWLEEQDAIKNTTREVAEMVMGEEYKNATKELTKLQATKLYQKVLHPTSEKLTKWLSNMGVAQQGMSTLNQFANRSINEAIEETAEEITFDTVKGLFKGIESVTGKKLSEDSYKALDFNWNLKDAMSRYATSFIGGALGGAVFEGINQYDLHRSPQMQKFLNLETRERLLWLIANGHEAEIMDELKSLRDRGALGNENLSYLKAIVSDEVKEKADKAGKVLFESGSATDNQNELVYQQLVYTVQSLKHFLSSNKFLMSDPKLLMDILQIRSDAKKAGAKTEEEIAKYASDNTKNPVIDKLIKEGYFNYVINDVRESIARLNDLNVAIDSKKQEIAKATSPIGSVDSMEETIKQEIKNNQELKDLQDEFDELKAEIDDVLSGNYADYYIEEGLFLIDPVFRKYFLDKKAHFRKNVESFYRFRDGKEFSEIKDEKERQRIIKEYKTFIARSEQREAREAFRLFRSVNERFAKDLTKMDQDLEGVEYDDAFDDLLNSQVSKRIEEIQKRMTELEQIINETDPNLPEYAGAEIEMKKLFAELAWIDQHVLDPSLSESGRVIIDSIVDYELVYRQNIENQQKESLEKQQQLQAEIDEATANGDIDRANTLAIQLEDEVERMQTELLYTVDPLLDLLQTYVDQSKSKIRTSSVLFNRLVSHIIETLERNNTGVFSNMFAAYRNTLSSLSTRVNAVKRGQFDSFIERLVQNPSNFKNLYRELIHTVATTTKFNGRNLTLEEAEEHVNALMHADPEFGRLFDLLMDDITAIKPHFNPALEVIRKLNIEIEGKPALIFEIAEEEIEKYNVNPDEYTFPSAAFEQDIKNGLKLINIVRAIFDAASNGYNSEVNQFRLALGHELFAELSDNSAQILQRELNQLEGKLRTLQHISEQHKTSSDRFQTNVMMNMSGKLLSSILTDDVVSKFKSIELEGKKLDIDLKQIWDSVAGESGVEISSLTEQNYIQFSLLEQKFRIEVAKQFIEFSKNLTVEAKETLGLKIAECFGEGIVSEDSGIMSDDPEYKPTAMQSLLYLTTIIGYDQEQYDSLWKAVTSSPAYQEFTPYYSQAIGTKIAWIRVNNNPLFNGIINYCKGFNSKSGDNYIKSRFEAYNLCCILGGPGTGKSSAMGRAIKLMADLVGGEVLLTAKEEEQRKNIKDNVDPQGNTAVIKSDDLLKDIGYKKGDVSIKEIGDDIIIEYKPSSELKAPAFQSKDGLKILMIDEISLFPGPEIQALCLSARAHGYSIIGLGDDKQNKAVIPYKGKNGDINLSTSIDDGITITTPSLTVSMRAENYAHYANSLAVDGYLIALTRAAKTQRNIPEFKIAENLVENKILPTQVSLFYHDETESETGTEFYGDIFTKASDPVAEARKWISRFKATGRKLIIVDWNIERWNDVADGSTIKVRTPLSVQGAEADYAVIIDDVPIENLFDAYRNLNTMMTRSSRGTVIVSTQDKFGGQIEIVRKPLSTGGIDMKQKDTEKQVEIKNKFKELAIGFLKDVPVFAKQTSSGQSGTEGGSSGQGGESGQSGQSGQGDNDGIGGAFKGAHFSEEAIPHYEVTEKSVEEKYDNAPEGTKLKDLRKWQERKKYLNGNEYKSDLKDFAIWLNSDSFINWIHGNAYSPFANIAFSGEKKASRKNSEVDDVKDFIYGIATAAMTKMNNDTVTAYLESIAYRFSERDDVYELMSSVVKSLSKKDYTYVISGKTIYLSLLIKGREVLIPISFSTDVLESGRYDDVVFEQKTQPIALTTSGEEFNEVEKVPMHGMHVVGYGIFAPTELSKLNKWTRPGNTIAAISWIPWLNPNQTFISFDGQSENEITRIGVQTRSTLSKLQKLIQAKEFLYKIGAPSPFEDSEKDAEGRCIELLQRELSWDSAMISKLQHSKVRKNWTAVEWKDFFNSFSIISEESVERLITALMSYVNTPSGQIFKDKFETQMANWTQSPQNGIIIEFASSTEAEPPKRLFLEFIGNENGQHKYKLYTASSGSRGRQINPVKKGNDQVIVSYGGKIIGFDTESLKTILGEEAVQKIISDTIVGQAISSNNLGNLDEYLNNGRIKITFGKRSNDSDYVYGVSEQDLSTILNGITLDDEFDKYLRTGLMKHGIYLDIKGSNYYDDNGSKSQEFKKPNSTENMECDIKTFFPPVFKVAPIGSYRSFNETGETFEDLTEIKTSNPETGKLSYLSYEQDQDVITFTDGSVDENWINEHLEKPFKPAGQQVISKIDLTSRLVTINDSVYKLNDKWSETSLETAKRVSSSYNVRLSNKTYTIGKGEIYSGTQQMIILEIKGSNVKFYDSETEETLLVTLNSDYLKYFNQDENLIGCTFWFVYKGNGMEDPFIAYRGVKAPEVMIRWINTEEIVRGQYVNDQIIVNGSPIVDLDNDDLNVSDYYSEYGIKLMVKPSEIKINEDDHSVTSNAIYLTKIGCNSLSSTPNPTEGNITHIDPVNRTFTIDGRIFKWRHDVTLDNFGLSDENRVFGNKAKKSEFIKSISNNWSTVPENFPISLREIKSRINDYTGDDFNEFLQSIAKEMNDIFAENIYKFGAKYVVEISDSGEFRIKDNLSAQYSAGHAVYQKFNSNNIEFDKDIDSHCIESKFVVSLPNGSQEGVVRKVNGKWTVEVESESKAVDGDVWTKLSEIVPGEVVTILQQASLESRNALLEVAKMNNLFANPQIARLISELMKYCKV